MWSRQLGVDPGGTAFHADEVLVADVKLPWPKPVWDKDGFGEVPRWVSTAGQSGRRVRVLAAVPDGPVGSVGSAAIVTSHHREPGSPVLIVTRHEVEHDSVPDLLYKLLTRGLGSSPSTVTAPRETTATHMELLVCTQGSHDVCCGTHGSTFASAVASSSPMLSVRRVSHTGGHRFAPTAMTLPDGRMWGLIDVDTMLGVALRSGSPAAVARYCRGWSGVTPGPTQMAERAVMAEVDDWSFDLTPRKVEIVASNDAAVTCDVVTPGDTWRVVILAGRELAVITCGAPGGLPAKPGREWTVASVERIC